MAPTILSTAVPRSGILLLILSLPLSIQAEEIHAPVPVQTAITPAPHPEPDVLLLQTRIHTLESQSGLSIERLQAKKLLRIRDISVEASRQRHIAVDFEGFVTWMSDNLAGYNRYLQAGSYLATVAKVLPVPYAGQASMFTKFATQFTLALNNASRAVANYLASSRTYITLVESLPPAQSPDHDKKTAEAVRFAGQTLLKDMLEAQARLATVSDLSASTLSFLESLDHYASSTDEYVNKVKGLFKKDLDPKEKNFVSGSASSLRARADVYNGRLRQFADITQKETTLIKTLAVFDELIAETKPLAAWHIPAGGK